ncbi:abkA, partial [Symbiodinium sp. KB8]
DCADDAAAVADALGVDSFIPVGYSMGGTIAQLVWRRHRDRVDGLVLGATAPYFAGRRPERLSFVGLTGLATIARYTPAQARAWITDQVYLQRKSEQWGPWAAEQVAGHDWRMILEAGRAIGEFSSTDWISDVDVPTSVVVTTADQVVPPRRQTKLWRWIPDADVFRVHGNHDAVVSEADLFAPQLVRAIHVAKLGAKVAGTHASTTARKVFASAERRVELDDERRLRTAQAVADELGHMKGALMKLGQMASYLDEGLPEPLRLALAQLRSDAPPMTRELAAQVVRDELGADPTDVFVEWDPDPIAAASIGQVHRAIAIDPTSGEERPVAVKLQYPGVDEAIDADLRNADYLGVLLKQGFGGLDPDDMVAEIKE